MYLNKSAGMVLINEQPLKVFVKAVDDVAVLYLNKSVGILAIFAHP